MQAGHVFPGPVLLGTVDQECCSLEYAAYPHELDLKVIEIDTIADYGKERPPHTKPNRTGFRGSRYVWVDLSGGNDAVWWPGYPASRYQRHQRLQDGRALPRSPGHLERHLLGILVGRDTAGLRLRVPLPYPAGLAALRQDPAPGLPTLLQDRSAAREAQRGLRAALLRARRAAFRRLHRGPAGAHVDRRVHGMVHPPVLSPPATISLILKRLMILATCALLRCCPPPGASRTHTPCRLFPPRGVSSASAMMTSSWFWLLRRL